MTRDPGISGRQSGRGGKKRSSGFWIYGTGILRVYDWLVPGILNRFVWKMPTSELHQLYQHWTGTTHLDIGVGSGYFLKPLVESQSRLKKLMLVDAHPKTLRHCQKLLGDFPISTFVTNILDAGELSRLMTSDEFRDSPPNSASANYLFHCLPRGLDSADEATAFASSVLAADGVFFGSTILGELATRRLTSRCTMSLFHRIKVFGNRHDSHEKLQCLLNKHFKFCKIETTGCVAMFVASNSPITPSS